MHWTVSPAGVIPGNILAEIQDYLPEKYSPIHRETGKGQQNIYLASISDMAAEILLRHLGCITADLEHEVEAFVDDDTVVRTLDDDVEAAVHADLAMDETTKRSVVEARRGQGRFRANVAAIEHQCRVTGVRDKRLLRASHIKPWRSCISAAERLDGNNGLLLTPHVDHLFDRGYLSFLDDGTVLVSAHIEASDLAMLGITSDPLMNVGPFNPEQAVFLSYHRRNVFLGAVAG